ncbi:MAG TPA: hypothetical protein VMU48_11985 [Terracidiphilus sp.]|nr:hypothetical protein [Terracidiphilus sp.]
MGTASNPVTSASRLDVVFDGTWVFVPSIDAAGMILGIEVYSPSCGHPHGGTFNFNINPNPWPTPPQFYMLDNHGHILFIQRAVGSRAGMNISAIDKTINQCVAARPMGSNWDLMISIPAGPDSWASGDSVVPQATNPAGQTVPCFSGTDVPTGQVSSLQTLTFNGVTAVELCGAPGKFQATIPSPFKGGSLIFEGEIPYIPTLLHERSAVSALANLAGLDLSLDYPLPSSLSSQPAPGQVVALNRTGGNCGHSVIVLP